MAKRDFVAARLALLLLPGVISLSTLRAEAQNLLSLQKDNKTDYVLLVSPTASSTVKQAAADLASYFKKSTGTEMPVRIGDTAPAGPFISLGDTKAARAAGFDPSAMPYDGFRMSVKGGNLFILGNDTPDGKVNAHGGVSNGTSNGIYTFCERFLNIRWFMPTDLGEDIPKNTSVEVPSNLDVTEVPQFAYRRLPYIGGERRVVQNWERRMRVGEALKLHYGHQWDRTIPASLYDKHPDWFAEIGGKRLPPAGRYKLETTNPELVQAYADEILKAFRADPGLKMYALSPTDGAFWSESAESKKYYDVDPDGKLSVTPLVLKFYNDVAKIVGKEFPNHRLGGYIYADYVYPPSKGIPPMEPNVALMLASSISYGYKLYRPGMQKRFEDTFDAWAKGAGNNDIYYYDLPTYFKQSAGTLMPPSPDILNTIYSRLSKHKNFKGIYIYGNPTWSGAGVGNYLMAKLNWDPSLDAKALEKEYYQRMYRDSAPQIEKIYGLVEAGFKEYYGANPDGGYDLTPGFLKKIYWPRYAEMDALYAQALANAKEPRVKARVEFFGHSLALMQWNLRRLGFLPADFKSGLTRSDEAIDALFASSPWTADKLEVAPISTALTTPAEAVTVQPGTGVTGGNRRKIIPLRGDNRYLLHATSDQVTIKVNALETYGEFARFNFKKLDGTPIKEGVLSENRVLKVPVEVGQNYLFDIANVWTDHHLEIEGAAWALKANAVARGLRIHTKGLKGSPFSLWVQVPPGVETFSLTINGLGALAEIFAPDGKMAGQIDTREVGVARLKVDAVANRAGFWRVTFQPHDGPKVDTAYLVLDPKLPQWASGDPEMPLVVTKK